MGAEGDLTDAVIGQGPAQQEERSPETVTSGGGFTDGRGGGSGCLSHAQMPRRSDRNIRLDAGA